MTHVTVYVEVEDLPVNLKIAVELGGKILVPPFMPPGQGSFAWLAVPEGSIIANWEPAKALKTEREKTSEGRAR